MYGDDYGSQALHYICGTAPQFWWRKLPWMLRAVEWLKKALQTFWSSSLSFLPPEPRTDDQARARLLQSLIDDGETLDFTSVDMRGDTPLHCCARHGSSQVMTVILDLAAASIVPVDVEDMLDTINFDEHTPLDISIDKLHWECVHMLCNHGALKNVPEFEKFKETLEATFHERNTVQVVPGGFKFLSFVQSVSIALTDMAGVNKTKLKKMESILSENDCSTMEDEVIGISGGAEELEKLFNQCIAHLSSTLDLSEPEALAVFASFSYNEGAAIQAYIDDKDGVVERAGLSFVDAQESYPTGHGTCIVCFEDVDPEENQSVHLPCRHTTCDDCWRGVLNARLEDGDVHRTVCSVPKCKLQLALTSVEKLLSRSQYDRFRELLAKRYADSNPGIRWCPKADCGNAVGLDSRVTKRHCLLNLVLSGHPIGVQCLCGHRFCWSCLESAHEPATCDQVREWRALLTHVHETNEAKSVSWLTKQTQSCPKCHAHIERNGGCNHMICTVCQQHFCYKCGKDWTGHVDYYNCTTMPDSGDEGPESEANGSSKSQKKKTNLFESLVGCFKSITNASWFEWHIQQYTAQSCNFKDVRQVSFYISRLIELGGPRSSDEGAQGSTVSLDESTVGDGGGGGREDSRYLCKSAGYSGDGCTVDVPKMNALIEDMANEICLSREVLQCSYILAFNMKQGSKKRFLQHMQAHLSAALEQLSFIVAQFPGFRQVAAMDLGDLRSVASDSESRTDTVLFVREDGLLHHQFLFSMALSTFMSQLESLAAEVHKWRSSLVASSRLSLFQKTNSDSLVEK